MLDMYYENQRKIRDQSQNHHYNTKSVPHLHLIHENSEDMQMNVKEASPFNGGATTTISMNKKAIYLE